MEIANLIINGCIFIGLWFIFYYQKSKISSLKTTIDSQKNILDSTQRFMDIFNLDTVERYVRITEDTIRQETDKKVREAEERAKKMKENQKITASELTKTISSWYGAAFALLMSIRPEDRETVIEQISEGDVKAQIKELSEGYKNTYNPPDPNYDNLIKSLGRMSSIYGKAMIVASGENDIKN